MDMAAQNLNVTSNGYYSSNSTHRHAFSTITQLYDSEISFAWVDCLDRHKRRTFNKIGK